MNHLAECKRSLELAQKRYAELIASNEYRCNQTRYDMIDVVKVYEGIIEDLLYAIDALS